MTQLSREQRVENYRAESLKADDRELAKKRDEALAVNPTDYHAMHNRGMALMRKRDLDGGNRMI